MRIAKSHSFSLYIIFRRIIRESPDENLPNARASSKRVGNSRKELAIAERIQVYLSDN